MLRRITLALLAFTLLFPAGLTAQKGRSSSRSSTRSSSTTKSTKGTSSKPRSGSTRSSSRVTKSSSVRKKWGNIAVAVATGEGGESFQARSHDAPLIDGQDCRIWR